MSEKRQVYANEPIYGNNTGFDKHLGNPGNTLQQEEPKQTRFRNRWDFHDWPGRHSLALCI